MSRERLSRHGDLLAILFLLVAGFLFMLKAMLPQPGSILYGYEFPGLRSVHPNRMNR